MNGDLRQFQNRNPKTTEAETFPGPLDRHIEIYDTGGNFLAGEIPFPYRILYTKGNRLYVTDWGEPETEETEENPTIVCMSLKF